MKNNYLINSTLTGAAESDSEAIGQPITKTEFDKNNIEQVLLTVCESVIIEKDTGKISLIGLFERMVSVNVPTICPKFTIFTKFEKGNGDHDHRILIRPEGIKEEIAKLDGKINFSSEGKAQYVGNFIWLPFPKFGKYIIEIYVDNVLQELTSTIEVKKL